MGESGPALPTPPQDGEAAPDTGGGGLLPNEISLTGGGLVGGMVVRPGPGPAGLKVVMCVDMIF